MAAELAPKTLIRFSVTPRFEIFYALRALWEDDGATTDWRRNAEKRLPKDFEKLTRGVAPHPMMWALLADTLRDAKADPTIDEILQTIESLEDSAFQKAILGGVFRGTGIVDALTAGEQSLGDAVEAESAASAALVGLIGLYPFDQSSAVARVFTRIIAEPAAIRADLRRALALFWKAAFSDSWGFLEPRMHRVVEAMQVALEGSTLTEFAREVKLPVVFDDRRRVMAGLRGATEFPYRTLGEIHVIPSAFNDARFWGAYADESGSIRLFFPVFNPGLLDTRGKGFDPALGFRALGDTTRYAMAFFLAQSPRTSVELANTFGVSKATVSHHVQFLRAAGLLQETVTDRGVVLALNREALERISPAAADEMFARGKSPVIQRSRHEKPGR
jgi:ArsR family transcriptional regulator